MLDNVLDWIKKVLGSRLFPISLIFIALFGILIHRLFVLQVVESEQIATENSREYTETREQKSTRGSIYDCNGVLLAYNELSYSVTMVDTGEYEDNEAMNDAIFKMLSIIEAYGGNLISDFGIRLNEDDELEYTVDSKSLLNFKRDAYSLSSTEELTQEMKDATAKEVFDFLRYDTGINSPKFEISDKYTEEEALSIMIVRFRLYMNRYKIREEYVPITIATNISEEAVAAIEENSDIMHGIEVVEETHRVYNESEYFSHILGYTGTISTQELEEKKEAGDTSYSSSDQIGKMGLEAAYEDELRGEKGYRKVIVDENSKVLEVLEEKEPVAGNDIYLTIDSKLQKACYKILEKQIAGILLSKIQNSEDSGTKGDSADGILIPIYDVYYYLFKNNVLHVNQMNQAKSTRLEKAVYKKYQEKLSDIFEQMDSYLAYNSRTVNSDAGDEMEDFLDYVYDFSVKKQILMTDEIDETDSMCIAYANNEISLSEFLQYALANRWIDLNKLSIGNEYYSTRELYDKLIEYIKKQLKKDSSFQKKIYYYLIYSKKLSGTEICLLLFDQGVLEYNEGEVAALQNGSVSAYDFITEKIRKLKITPGQLGLEPCSGSVVVTDVKTGNVLAMVSYPSYNNNKLANSIHAGYYTDLVDEDGTAYPMLNRATQQRTAPGSTFKMVSAVASLEEEIIDADTRIKDKVTFDEIEPPPSCWNRAGHGSIDVSEALGVSCNYFFYEMGYRLGTYSGGYNSEIGLKKLKKYAGMLGLSDKSGIEVPEAEPQNSDEDAVRSAIGQGTNAYTPVQLARYVTTLANNGNCYNLTLISKIKQKEKTILNHKAELLHKVSLSDTTWNKVHDGMYQVVYGPESSVGSLFEQLGKIKVAGKTGTAQTNDYHPNHALFVSYAPYKNPEMSVTVVIPNGYSSSSAAEVAADIYLYHYDKESQEELLTDEAKRPEISNIRD